LFAQNFQQIIVYTYLLLGGADEEDQVEQVMSMNGGQ
jgi:hypothetical protein